MRNAREQGRQICWATSRAASETGVEAVKLDSEVRFLVKTKRFQYNHIDSRRFNRKFYSLRWCRQPPHACELPSNADVLGSHIFSESALTHSLCRHRSFAACSKTTRNVSDPSCVKLMKNVLNFIAFPSLRMSKSPKRLTCFFPAQRNIVFVGDLFARVRLSCSMTF